MSGPESLREETQLRVFDQIMDGVLYIQMLDKHLLDILLEKHFPGTEYHFMQNSDPKHTSRLQNPTIKKRTSIGGQPLPVVQISIQLNVFGENWNTSLLDMKPLNKKELISGICLLWVSRMSPAKCIKYDNWDYWAETQQSLHWKDRTFWSVDLLAVPYIGHFTSLQYSPNILAADCCILQRCCGVQSVYGWNVWGWELVISWIIKSNEIMIIHVDVLGLVWWCLHFVLKVVCCCSLAA